MKKDIDLAEERINSEIKDKSRIVNFCFAYSIKPPYPGFINPLVLFILVILEFTVSRIFGILLLLAVIIIIIVIINSIKHYLLVFLEDELRLIQIKGKDLMVGKSYSYRYKDIVKLELNGKNLIVKCKEGLGIDSIIRADYYSFKSEDFDVKKFVEEKSGNKEPIN
jgi:hypothetical protein